LTRASRIPGINEFGRVIDEDAIRQPWEAVGLKLDERGRGLRRSPFTAEVPRSPLGHPFFLLRAWIVMEVVFVLLAVSAIGGLVLGFYLSWMAILASGLVLAIVSATLLQKEGFGFLAGIAIIVVCLTVNQIAYLIGVRLSARGPPNT
jgi:hypothetical protein